MRELTLSGGLNIEGEGRGNEKNAQIQLLCDRQTY